MKSNKKFPPALGAIVDQALKDKSAWVGKTVQDLTCEAIRKRGLSQEDEGCICLTLDEAKNIYHDFASMYVIAKGTYPKDGMRKPFTLDILKMEIEKAGKCNE